MQKTHTIKTKYMIALCHMINEYEKFEKDLKNHISPKYDREFIFKLSEI